MRSMINTPALQAPLNNLCSVVVLNIGGCPKTAVSGDDMNNIDLANLIRQADIQPVRKLWAMVLMLALKDKASEVRYEPWRNKDTLRYRVGGVYYEMIPPPRSLASEMVKTILTLDQPPPPLLENWRTRWARMFRRWADSLDPPLPAPSGCVEYLLSNCGTINVRATPAADDEKWVGVVVQLHPNDQASDLARSLLEKLYRSSRTNTDDHLE